VRRRRQRRSNGGLLEREMALGGCAPCGYCHDELRQCDSRVGCQALRESVSPPLRPRHHGVALAMGAPCRYAYLRVTRADRTGANSHRLVRASLTPSSQLLRGWRNSTSIKVGSIPRFRRASPSRWDAHMNLLTPAVGAIALCTGSMPRTGSILRRRPKKVGPYVQSNATYIHPAKTTFWADFR